MSRKRTFSEATSSATPPTSATIATASGSASQTVVRVAGISAKSRTISATSITANGHELRRDDRERHELAREARLPDQVGASSSDRDAIGSDVAKKIQTQSPQSRNSG